MTQNQLGEYIKGAVFPQNVEHPDGNVTCLGLTKREYFVGQTIVGLFPLWWKEKSDMEIDEFVEMAIEIADKALKQLNEPQP